MNKKEEKAFEKYMRKTWSHVDLSTKEKLVAFCKRLVNYLKPINKG